MNRNKFVVSIRKNFMSGVRKQEGRTYRVIPERSPLKHINNGSGTPDFLNAMIDEKLIYEVLSVVEEIPPGKVATYGQIAKLIGREKNARLVGKILGMSPCYGQYPCHRVVNHAGRTAPGWAEQPWLLQCEGVQFKGNGCVNLQLCQWTP